MAQPTAITIGNFDGVHLGHAKLVQTSRALVGKTGRVVALVFDPHPMTILRPDAVPTRLSTMAQRTTWLRTMGVDEVVTLTPTCDFLGQSPREFIEKITANFSPGFIVEGPDFHFGKGRAGSVDTLHELEQSFGYQTHIVYPVEAALCDQSTVTVSSSVIRWLIQHGRVRDAGLLLGRPYELVSTVVSGDKRGRTIGVPTINLANTGCLLPADGIYAGRANRAEGETYPAAISIGTKPTFGEHPRTCEAHLIGYHGPLDDYGWNVRLQFTDWLRDQLTYTSVEPLIDQLKRDITNTAKAIGTGHQALVPSA